MPRAVKTSQDQSHLRTVAITEPAPDFYRTTSCDDPLLASKRLRQSGLTQDRVGGMSAWDSNGDCEISRGYWTMPDFVTAFALPDKRTACSAQ